MFTLSTYKGHFITGCLHCQHNMLYFLDPVQQARKDFLLRVNTNTYHHENLKQELIETAIKIVAEEGLKALTIRSLAAACGVSHTAPYKHFRNKDEIIAALTNHAKERFAASLLETLAAIPKEDTTTRIVELGKSYVGFMVENPYYLKVLFFTDATRTINQAMVEERTDLTDPLSIFKETAIAHLIYHQIPPEQYEYCLVGMWGVVHGITLMLLNGNWLPEGNYLDAVEFILKGETR